MTILKLRDAGVRRATRLPVLAGLPRIGRGTFAAVYDNGNSVLKLTCDRVHYSMLCDGLAPRGEHFPKVIRDYGEVGEMKGDPLFLVEVEKLTSIHRSSPEARTSARKLIKIIEHHWSRTWTPTYLGNQGAGQKNAKLLAGARFLRALMFDQNIPEQMRQAFEELSIFVENFQCGLDFHPANIMCRGEYAILNDVVIDDDFYNERMFGARIT